MNRVLITCAVGLLFVPACNPESTQITPIDDTTLSALVSHLKDHGQPPEEYILSKLRTNRVVLLGEMHRIRHDVELVHRLLPRLHEVNVFALGSEFFCVEDQELLDAVVTGPEYREEEARELLRHGTGGTWAFQEYLDILRVAWDYNHSRMSGEPPLRIIGLIPRLDYWKLNEGTEEERQAEREKSERYDEIMAQALEREVLRTGGKALVHCGINHAYSGYEQPRIREGKIAGYRDTRCGNRLLSAYPNEVVTVYLHAPWWQEGPEPFYLPFGGAFDQAFLEYGQPVGFDLAGSPFAKLRAPVPEVTEEHAWISPAGLYDGYILLAPIDEYQGVRVIEDWVESEEVFEELRRQLPNRRWAATLASPEEYVQGIDRDTEVQRMYAPILEEWIRFRKSR